MNNLSVTKSNILIDARYKLNVQAQKLVLACLSKIDPRTGANVSKEITMTAVEYGDLMGIKNNARRDLYRAADALFKSSVKLQEGNNETELYWVQKKVAKIKGEGAITLCWSDDIFKYITQLRGRFTTYKLRNIANLNSSHSIRLYELLMRFSKTGERVISVADLKSTLGISDKYKEFKILKRDVINPAVKELNQCSDLTIKFTTMKNGRSIGALLFEFKQKKQMQFKDF